MAIDERKLHWLIARAEIQDVMLRYCRGVDRCEWDLIRECFHTDAIDDHGPYRGDVDGLIDWVSRRHVKIGQSMHFIGNCLIEFASEETALCETYFIALQRLGPEAGESKAMLGTKSGESHQDLSVLGRYIDRFELRAGHWKIARRFNLFEAIRSTAVTDPSMNREYNWHRRDHGDPLFAIRREVLGFDDLPAITPA